MSAGGAETAPNAGEVAAEGRTDAEGVGSSLLPRTRPSQPSRITYALQPLMNVSTAKIPLHKPDARELTAQCFDERPHGLEGLVSTSSWETGEGFPRGSKLSCGHSRRLAQSPASEKLCHIEEAVGRRSGQNIPAAFMPALSPPLVRTATRRSVLRGLEGTAKRISGLVGAEEVSSLEETDMMKY